MTVAAGMLTKLGIDSSNPVTKRFDFMEGSNIGCDEESLDGNGMRGTLSHDISRVRAGRRRVSGNLSFQPNAAELALLLPWILGGTPTGSGTVTYPLADTHVTRYVAADRNAGSLFLYDGVAVDRAVITAAEGQIVRLSLEVVGIDETISGSFPSLNIDRANGPFTFMDCALSINSTSVQAKELEITIDNMIDRERFLMSRTLTATKKQDRTISFRTQLPWGDYNALYNLGAQTGVVVAATFTNGGAELGLTMNQVVLPRRPLDSFARREVMMPLEGKAYRDGTNLELITTLNVGP